MDKSTIIFGNGLGMALNQEHFSLERVLEKSWDDPNSITNEEKVALETCLQKQGNFGTPKSESDFNYIYQVLNACQVLLNTETERVNWLTDSGKIFPGIVGKFITSTAWKLFDNPDKLPDSFLLPLTKYLSASKSHIATLNYDNLLYGTLCERGILKKEYRETTLVDGFNCLKNPPFRNENLDRKYRNEFGYYLHLHGSPLFVGEKDSPKKLPFNSNSLQRVPSKHLVLSNFSEKPVTIASSYLLRTYWQYFEYALSESKSIFIIGYKGCDPHLNQIIYKHVQNKKIVVVEWSGEEGINEKRNDFWKHQIIRDTTDTQLTFKQYDSILDFTEWN